MRIPQSAGLLLGVLLVAQSALAGEAVQNSAHVTRLEPIKVTASKDEEQSVQKVSGSISAYSETEVEEARMQNVQDLSLRVPNLNFYTGGLSLINFPTLRGIRSDPHNNVSAVAMYIDGVPVSSNLGYVSDMYDITRVEVLRGPQGTLYGKSTEGGVINIVTRQPGNDPQAKATLEGGNSRLFNAKASASVPLVNDLLYFEVAGSQQQRDGWVKNDFDGKNVDDKKNYSGRAKLRYTPIENLDVTLGGSLLKYQEGSFSMYQWPSSNVRHADTDTPGYNRSKIDEQSLNIKYAIDDKWSLTSVSSRRAVDADYLVDYDFSTAKGWETHKFDQYNDLTQELRLNYSSNGASFLLGGMVDNNRRRVQYELPSMGTVVKTKDVTDTYSIFAHTRQPLVGALSFVGGLRYDAYQTDFSSDTFSESDSWSSYSPKAGLEYEFTDDNMAYLTASRGFRAAGYNSYTPPAGKNSFKEESLWSYEIGSKNLFFDRSVKLNASIFYNDIKNVQVEQYVNTLFGPMPYIDNAGSTHSYGAELEASWFPLAGLELFGSVGYTHIRYGEFTDALGDHRDNRLPYVPDYTYSLGFDYHHDSGCYIRSELLGTSSAYLDSSNTYKAPAYATVNARLGWASGQYDVYLFGTNLLDRRYDLQGAFGGGYAVASQPLTVGLGLTYHFF